MSATFQPPSLALTAAMQATHDLRHMETAAWATGVADTLDGKMAMRALAGKASRLAAALPPDEWKWFIAWEVECWSTSVDP